MRGIRLPSLLWLFFLSVALFHVYQWVQLPYIDTHALRRVLRVVDGTHNQCFLWGSHCIEVMMEHSLYIFALYLVNRLLYAFGILHPLLVNHLVFGLFFGAFVTAVVSLSRAYGLRGWRRLPATLFVLLGAPGLVLMMVQTEDDVAYFCLLLLFWWFIAKQGNAPSRWRWSDNQTPWKEGLIAGTLLGVAMTINPIVLIHLAMGATVPLLLWRKEKEQALKIVCAGVTSVVVFYLLYLPLYPNVFEYKDPFYGSLLKALTLWRGHGEQFNTIPLFSKQYFARSYLGFTSMVLQPRHAYFGWKATVLKFVPWVWLATAAVLALRALSHWGNAAMRSRPRGALLFFFFAVGLGQALVFETGVNERWSMAFLGFCMLFWWVWSLETRWWMHLFFVSFVTLQVALGASNLYSQAIGDINIDFHAKLRRLQKSLKPYANRGAVDAAILPSEFLQLDLYARTMISKATHRVVFARKRKNPKPGQIPWTFHRRKAAKETYANFLLVEYFDEWHRPDKVKHELSLAELKTLLRGKRVFVHPTLRAQWKRWLTPRLGRVMGKSQSH